MKLNAIFNSNMVFAADKPIRIYGDGSGLAEIEFAGMTKKIYSSEDKWLVEFPAMQYGGPYELKAVFETEEVVLDNIYIGNVYVFAGQSNMQFKLKESTAPDELYESNDILRLFSTERIEKTDRFTPADGWVISKREAVGDWSAIAYLAANEISKEKDIAVGVISAYQGASVIESWLPKGTCQKLGLELPIESKHYDHTYPDFLAWNGEEGILFDYALSQIIPFSVSGVVWYQGESDTSAAEAAIYDKELAALVYTLRDYFDDDELPFVVIQIADFDTRNDEEWKLLQKKQLEIQDIVENVFTVISSDVCERDNIHPPTKHKLAHKVASKLIEI